MYSREQLLNTKHYMELNFTILHRLRVLRICQCKYRKTKRGKRGGTRSTFSYGATHEYNNNSPTRTRTNDKTNAKQRNIDTLTVITAHRPQPKQRRRPPSTLITIPTVSVIDNHLHNNTHLTTLDTQTVPVNTHSHKHSDKHTLTILNMNCRSLISHEKKLQLEQVVETFHPDIILGTETHLDENIDSKSIFNENYLHPPPYRKDRRRGQGGVLIAVNSGLTPTQKDANTNCEVIWSKISLTKGDVLVGCFYRQPSSSIATLEQLHESLKKLLKKGSIAPTIILGGDFNLPDINWDTLSIKSNPQYGRDINEKMVEIVRDFNLTQIVKEPTRENNILDLIFTTNPDLVKDIQIHPGMSDHEIVMCEMDIQIRLHQKPPRSVYAFSKGNMNGIKSDLKEYNETFEKQTTYSQDVNKNWETFKTKLMSTVDKHIPKKTISGKPHLPWITHKIKRLIRQKQRRYKVAKEHNTQQDWEKFRSLRKTIHKELRKEHNRYVKDMLEPDTNDNKSRRITNRFWKYIRSKRKETSTINVLQRPDGSDAIDSTEKANILKSQYESVFTSVQPTLPTIDQCDIPTIPRIQITTAGVMKQLQDLNASKASGPDLIPTRILKECAIEVAPYLRTIFQQSIDYGTVPTDWKHAKITPVFKKGKRDLPSNYRPVSLTSVCCKILEHIIFHYIMNHFEKHKILVHYQHGFRKHHSCETQLINTLETITRSQDERKQTDLLVLDFSKAFDTVPHEGLLMKLEHSGIRDTNPSSPDTQCNEMEVEHHQKQNILRWFRDWLCDRTQEVVVDGVSSEKSKVLSGVPQGTVLGPLCFLIFINDLGHNVSSETSLKLFADDSLLFRVIRDQKDTKALQADLDALLKWASTWKMKFHPAKCVAMSITNSKKPIAHAYQIHGQQLQHVDNIKYLGVHLDRSLKWNHHVNDIVAKAYKSLGFLKRNLHQCPETVKAQAYTALVRPILEYASAAWDPHQKGHINAIEQVQRTAARFVTNCRSHEPGCITKALQHLGWRSLEKRRKDTRLKLLHRSIHAKSTIEIPQYFRKHKSTYSTRNQHPSKFTQPFARTNTYKNSFFTKTICEWNSLPTDITDTGSPEFFTRALEAFLQV